MSKLNIGKKYDSCRICYFAEMCKNIDIIESLQNICIEPVLNEVSQNCYFYKLDEDWKKEDDEELRITE